jgi:plastocyanin
VKPFLFWTTMASVILLSACEDQDFPQAEHEVRIEEGRFFPKDPEIRAGSSVRWVNILPKAPENVRTVTSGTPADSTSWGLLFDEVLDGREVGEVEGDAFIHTFRTPGSYPYFSRFPEEPVLTGTVVVR